MKKLKKTLIGVLLALGLVGSLGLPALATDGGNADNDSKKTIEPTFVVEGDEDSTEAGIWFGKNYMLFGDTLKTKANVKGLMLAAGSNLDLRNNAEYGFFAGETLHIRGQIEKDVFTAGNHITIESDAKLGRDVFVAGNDLTVKADLNGDLSFTGNTLTLNNIDIAGNLNITAENVEITGEVNVAGSVVLNDDAKVSGMDNLKHAGNLEFFHLDDADSASMIAASWYSKVASMIGLFVVMALIFLLAPKTHDRIGASATGAKFALNLVIGLGVLVITPIAAIMLLMTVVATPLSIVALVIWGLMIYLSQGFAGAWLGHIIIEKLFKSNGNAYVEAALGIVILGVLSMVPGVGGITGLLGLLLGMGLIVTSIRGGKAELETQYYVDETVETPKKTTKSTKAKTTSSKSSKSTKSAKKK